MEGITRKELEEMPQEYKTTIQQHIDFVSKYYGSNNGTEKQIAQEMAKIYKEQGYVLTDYMILKLTNEGTVLVPVKVINR